MLPQSPYFQEINEHFISQLISNIDRINDVLKTPACIEDENNDIDNVRIACDTTIFSINTLLEESSEKYFYLQAREQHGFISNIGIIRMSTTQEISFPQQYKDILGYHLNGSSIQDKSKTYIKNTITPVTDIKTFNYYDHNIVLNLSQRLIESILKVNNIG